MGEVRSARPVETVELFLHAAHVGLRGLDDALPFRLRLTDDELRLALGLLADLATQLLRRHQRIVERLVALAECAQLLVKAPRLGVEILIDSGQTLHLLRDLIPELIHARRVVAAQRPTEVVAAHVEWCQMKRFVNHYSLAPKRVVPSRTIVAPSSTAIS